MSKLKISSSSSAAEAQAIKFAILQGRFSLRTLKRVAKAGRPFYVFRTILRSHFGFPA
ncbi:hypothetical protein AGR6A_Cc80292 [Agrobacterium sp. NCPPB 925]|nr:hypothetical protein AGR6A_Cc80292 [Agrobacterium sp. NCPPB 925]